MSPEYVKCKSCGSVNVITAQDKGGSILCKTCRNIIEIESKDIQKESAISKLIFVGDEHLDNGKFTEAVRAYQNAIELDPSNEQGYCAEAYFYKALAMNSVRLLNDRVSNTKQPICFDIKSGNNKFVDDENYKKAIKFASEEQKAVFEDLAKRIDHIVDRFNEYRGAGLKWDCFICTKVSQLGDSEKEIKEYINVDDVNKTADCVLASDLNAYLANKDIKSFFSEVSCKDFVGDDYEALILYALYVSPVMIVVCRNKEYLYTQWVQNEYERYYEFIKSGIHDKDSIVLFTNNEEIKLPLKNKIGSDQQVLEKSPSAYSDIISKILSKRKDSSIYKGKAENAEEKQAELSPETQALIKRAQSGDLDAKLLLGKYLFYGEKGLAENHKEAYKLFKEVADRGNPYARFMQGECRYTDIGTRQSLTECAEAYKNAAERGCVQAQCKLGECYQSGCGVDEDTRLAVRWLKKAAKRGYARAQEKLADVYRGNFSGGRAGGSESKSRKILNYNSRLALSLSALAIATMCLALIVGIFALAYKTGINLRTATGRVWLVGCAVFAILVVALLAKLIWYLKSFCNKKRSVAVLLILAIVFSLLFGGISVGAANFVDYYYDRASGLYYSVNSDGTLTVWAEKYDMTQLDVPAQIDGKRVKIYKAPAHENKDGAALTSVTFGAGLETVADGAFADCEKLISATLPYGLVTIGGESFSNCNSLLNISIPDSVKSVGDNAFAGCAKLTIYCEAESEPSEWSFSWNPDKLLVYWGIAMYDGYIYQVIGATVKVVGYFGEDSQLNIPAVINEKPVVAIGDKAFKENLNITSVTIPGSVASIGDSAFYKCGSLKSATLAEGVTSIGDGAFESCRGLTNITIPYTMTSIGAESFSGCDKLTSIVLLDKVATVGDNTFKDCTSLTINCEVSSKPSGWSNSWNPNNRPVNWNYVDNPDYTFIVSDGNIKILSYIGNDIDVTVPQKINGKPIVSIEASAFKNKSNIRSLILPDTVTYIGASVFEGCSALTGIEVPSGVTCIISRTFYGCASLANVVLPSGLTSVDSDAFSGCDNIKNATIPAIVIPLISKNKLETVVINGGESIADEAFYSCWNLASVEISDSVTSIGSYAFWFCDNLTSIKMSRNITSIGNDAFGGCSSLINIELPDNIESIGNEAFSDCSSLSSIIIPRNVTNLGYGAFSNCSNLKIVEILGKIETLGDRTFYCCRSLESINLPSSVTSIGKWAFYSCNNITRIYIPSSISSIGDDAFIYCNNIISATIPALAISYISKSKLETVVINGGESIADEAFKNCSELESVVILSGITSVGSYAFYGCNSLTSIVIPDSVDSIGAEILSGCSSLASIETPFKGGVYDVASEGIGIEYEIEFFGYLFGAGNYNNQNSFIPETLTTVILTKMFGVDGNISPYMFYGCSNITTVVIPDGVLTIGSSAFYGCTKLSSINIPSSVFSISINAFYKCSSLTNIEIPSGVSDIGSHAFYECSSMTSIVIPSSVFNTGSQIFYGCSSLKSVEIGEIPDLGSGFFSYCSSLTSIELPGSLNSISNYAFSYCSNLVSVAFEDNSRLSVIGGGAFEGCGSLTNIEIPNSVTSIGSGAFSGCSSLTSIEIPSSVTSIGSSTFEGCRSLTCIEIPSGVTSIGKWVFYDCRSLTIIEIPSSVTSIGDYAFSSCSNLVSVAFEDNSRLSEIGSYSFYYCRSLTSIEIPSGVTSIGGFAFYGCSSLTSIKIPDGVTSIGSYVFYLCRSMTSIEIPSGVTSIGLSAFSDCISLTSIEIPNSVTSIGEKAFFNCSSLTSITVDVNNLKYRSENNCLIGKDSNTLILGCINSIIPDYVTSIGDHAFLNCSSLTSIVIPSSVTSIGNQAFYNCSSLTGIEIPSSVTSIGDQAFEGCTGLISIEIPSSVTSIGGDAFAVCGNLTIYCEAASEPSGWNRFWNISKCPVVWGYKAS